MTKFALFDFDNTVCRGDSVVPYLLYSIRRGVAPWTQVFRALHGYVHQRLHPDEISAAKTLALSFLRGRTQEQMDDHARGFFREVLCKRFYPRAAAEMQRLKDEGFTVVVITASVDAYMRVLCEFLPVDAVLATRCAVDQDDCYTGDIGENCKGAQKAFRLASWMAQHHLELDYDVSCAYGDSPSDLHMLNLTASPRLVNPHRRLAAALPDAPVHRWTISEEVTSC